QLPEHTVRVGIHELVVLESADASGGLLGHGVQALPVLRGHLLELALLLRRDLAALPTFAGVRPPALDPPALVLHDLVELLLDFLQRRAEIVTLELLLPLLAELIDHVLEARHGAALRRS